MLTARMANDAIFGGIERSGASGSYGYALKPGYADKPVVFVTFYGALRFANWLHNGEPVGDQGPATTEGGAYTISLAGIGANSIARNPSAATNREGRNPADSSDDIGFRVARSVSEPA